MLKVEIAPIHEENFPGNLTEIFEDENLLGWAHWEGPAELVTPDKLQEIIGKIKISSTSLPVCPTTSRLSMITITGSNEKAGFFFSPNTGIQIQRGDKVITLSQNATGKLLETDKITFLLNNHHPINPSTPIKSGLGTTVPKFLALHQVSSMFRNPRLGLEKLFQQKKSLYLALVVFLVLLSSILYQLRSKTMEVKLQSITDLSTQAELQIKDAQSLADLNNTLARSQLLQAKVSFVDQANAKFPGWQNSKKSPGPELQKIQSEFDQGLEKLSRSYKVSSLDTFYDFNILKSDAKVGAIAFYDGRLLALDPQTGIVFNLLTESKNGSILGSQDKFKGGKFLDFSGDQISVFNGEGVFGYPKAITLGKTDDWGNILQMKMFAGNIYLLSSDKSMIWKYIATDNGYSDLKKYLGDGLSVNFSKVVGFAIDGQVYVLSGSGNIAKFSGGLPQDFNIKGLIYPLRNSTAIYTSDKTTNIYILDSDNQKVVVLDKKGSYQSQYLLPAARGEGLAASVAADETLKKIFLLSGSKVYSIDIK